MIGYQKRKQFDTLLIKKEDGSDLKSLHPLFVQSEKFKTTRNTKSLDE